MRSSIILPALALTLSPLASAGNNCFNSFYGHSCNGSIYGISNPNDTADLSQLICCQDSKTCAVVVDGSITQCPSGTALSLTNLTAIPTTSSSSSGAPTSTATSSASASTSAKPNAAVRMTAIGGFGRAAWVA